MIHSHIETRQNRNSQFDNQLEQVNTEEQFYRNVPEVGALISVQGLPFVGNGYEFVQLATVNQIPFLTNGYQVAYDGQNTDVSHAQGLTSVEQIVANDAAEISGELNIYSNNLFYLQDRVIYTITISFTSQLSTNNAHAQLFFGYNGIPYNGDSDVLYYAKGNNVAHQFSRTYQIVGDSSTADGISLYIFPSHAGKLWGAKFTIQRAF